MKDEKYLISVIVPIYNVKDYLEETIKSIINQTIGFENIELILVNDGSPYGEDEICKKYDEMYENIIYINQENTGVSGARNKGMKSSHGKYINFIDSDDKLESDAFEKAINMLEENPEINIVGLRLKFFEASKGYHTTDHKFDKGDRIVDINEEYSALQLSASSSVMRRKALKGIEFDTALKYSEDAKFVTEVLFKNKTTKYGLLKSANYLYRRRKDRNSSIQTQTFNKKWYTFTCENVYEYVLKLSQEIFGEIIPYAQYLAAYHLQFRINKAIDVNMSSEEIEEYDKCIKRILDNIDDYIILEQTNMLFNNKLQMLNLKYGKDISKDIVIRDEKIYYKNNYIIDLEKYEARLVQIEEDGSNLILNVLINTFLDEKQLSISSKVGIQDINYSKTNIKLCNYNQEYYPNMKMINIKIPKKDNKIRLKYKGTKILFTANGLYNIINNKNTYFRLNNILISSSKKSLIISKSIPRKINRLIRNAIYMLVKYKKHAVVIFASDILKRKYKDVNIVYLFDESIKDYVDKNIPSKNTYYVSNNKEDSTINIRSFKYKMILLNSKNIYTSINDINKTNVSKPFGKATKIYTNKMNACYHIINNRKITDEEKETINILYKKSKIINI